MAVARAARDPEKTLQKLTKAHPDAHCELTHTNPFELIVATVLSAQSTDVAVNRLTPELFQRWPTPEKLAAADPAALEKLLSRIGMFRQKTRSLLGLSKMLVEKYGGQVPRSLAELIVLPGVGRKTANVVLGVAFNTPEGVVVDTHVQRISQRLGWTKHTDPENIERDLMKRFPKTDWDRLSHILIFHGRRICIARKPSCAACPINDVCPSAFHAENVGRKAGGRRRSPEPVVPAKTLVAKKGQLSTTRPKVELQAGIKPRAKLVPKPKAKGLAKGQTQRA